MELALSLGQDTPKPSFSFLHHQDLGIQEPDSSSHPPVQLDLLPFSPVHPSSTNLPLTWLNEKRRTGPETTRKFAGETDSLFPMGFPVFRGQKRDFPQIINNEDDEHGSDEEENGMMGRKKLRLSKEQSAFLEDSFKEHSTLNPKQKIGLAKQLNLRPRQVEVWFQNRRARTKLKQTEVDCEYLRKCHEALTEENRRLQKELHELRALKASKPFYMQRPATTLTMCPSCERVVTAGAAAPAAADTVAQQDAS